MPRSTPRAILFDAVGTLLRPSNPVSQVYHAAGRRCGSRLTEAAVAERFRAAFADQEVADARRDQRTNARLERRRWQNIVKAVFSDVADTRDLFAALWNHFAAPEAWRLYEDVAPCWRELTAGGLILGIASNFDHRLVRICRATPPLDACRHVFISSRLGCKKPSPAFFRRIEQALNLPPSRLLLVGDDRDHDYAAARASGWQALWLDRSGRATGPDVIYSLDQIPAMAGQRFAGADSVIEG